MIISENIRKRGYLQSLWQMMAFYGTESIGQIYSNIRNYTIIYENIRDEDDSK